MKISILAFISFFLGLLSFFILALPVANTLGIISSLEITFKSLLILLFIIPMTFILGVISKTITRKKEKEIWGRKLADYSIRISLIVGILFFFIAATIPSNQNIVRLNEEIGCEEEIKEIADAVESYIRDKRVYPEDLQELVENRYFEEIPKFRYREEYIYKIESNNERKYFVLECPKPEGLIKGRGLRPPRKCLEIKYIQGKGLIVKTE